MIQKIVIFFLVLNFSTLSDICAQQSEYLQLKLDTLPDTRTEIKVVYHPKDVKVWENRLDTTIIDSVLYKCVLPDITFFVLVKRENKRMVYQLPVAYNSFQKKNISYSFPTDSLNKWNAKTAPKSSIMKLAYPLDEKWDDNLDAYLFLIPYFNGFKFSDQRKNDFFLSFSMLKLKRAEYKGYILDVYNSIERNGDKVQIIIKDKSGNTFRDSYLNKERHKSIYNLGDTVSLGNDYFGLDSLGRRWDVLYLSRLANNEKKCYIMSDEFFNKVKPFFLNGNKYLLIDFWGTWCAPCIKNFPALKALYESVNKRCSFLSVCFDIPEHLAKAKAILNENDINWGTMLDNQKNPDKSLTLKLGVNVFPTYILINDRKEILFRDEGEEGGHELSNRIDRMIDGD